MINPFRPTAGATPPDIIGRTGVLDEFEYGLDIRSGAPGLLSIITGARGIGKTVMLGVAEDMARAKGWVVISETATAGFLGRLGKAMEHAADELGDGPPRRRITGISAGGFSIATSLPPEQQLDWRQLGEELLGHLEAQKTGLLITVDEIHAADRSELAQLAASVQHFIRDGLPVALVFAGLPAAVSDLLNEGVATFLRRADRIDLHAAAVGEVKASYLETFNDAGFTLSPALARQAAEATDGYPFLIQLVGYHLWQLAEVGSGTIDAEDVQKATRVARRRNTRVVIEAALSEASSKDLDFLLAMAVDDGPSSIAEVGTRMGDKRNTSGNYRSRLIAAGLAEPAGRGNIRFAIPGLREYLLAKYPDGA